MTTETAPRSTPKRPRLRKGFFVGFAIVFVGLLMKETNVLVPGGNGVMSVPVFRYYLIELQRAVHSSGNLSLTSGAGPAAIVFLFQHSLCSAVGGVIGLGIAWFMRKRQSPNDDSSQSR